MTKVLEAILEPNFHLAIRNFILPLTTEIYNDLKDWILCVKCAYVCGLSNALSEQNECGFVFYVYLILLLAWNDNEGND